MLPNSRRAGRLPTLAPARCACRSLGFPAICQASSCSSLNLPGHFNKWLLIRVPALAIASTPDETARGQAASARGVHGGTARKTTFDNVSRLAQSVKQAHDQVRRYWRQAPPSSSSSASKLVAERVWTSGHWRRAGGGRTQRVGNDTCGQQARESRAPAPRPCCCSPDYI